MLLTHALLADRHITSPSPSFLSLSNTLTNLWSEMLVIVKCETADVSHRNKALSGCLDILKGFLMGLTAIPLNLNSELCVMGATFVEDFSDLETPPHIQVTTSIHTHSHTHDYGQMKNRHNKKHQNDEKSDITKSRSNSNSNDRQHSDKDGEKVERVDKIKNMKVENNEQGKKKDKDRIENKYVNVDVNEYEKEANNERNKNIDENKNKNEVSENGNTNRNDNDNDNDDDDDNEGDDNIATNDWLHYCDQSGIDLSLANAQAVYLSSLNDHNNNNNNNNSGSSNSSSSNNNSNSSRGGEGGRSRTGSMRTSMTPTHEREREREKGRDRGRDRDSIDDKIAQTRSRSHLLLALPSIVSIICLNIPHTNTHTSTHTSINTDINANTSTSKSNEENEGLKLLQAAACRAVSRVNMTALVESYNGLEERAKQLKAENAQLQIEVYNLNSNANSANLPF